MSFEIILLKQKIDLFSWTTVIGEKIYNPSPHGDVGMAYYDHPTPWAGGGAGPG